MLSKVPEVTIYFWVIKILCTTVGESAADFLNVDLGFGLTWTSVATGIVLIVALYFQFRESQYNPKVYWLAVVLISVFGTLITDILSDEIGVPLEASTLFFSVTLLITFVIWYEQEKTLSIHSIVTWRRELFYWFAILSTFALGTAAGDLMAESLGLGYPLTGIIVASAISAITILWYLKLDAVLAFWLAYILTRPLGASLGDYLSQSAVNGGIGLGATVTSAIFAAAIFVLVAYWSITKRDLMAKAQIDVAEADGKSGAGWQTAVVVSVLVLIASSGYYWRQVQLNDPSLLNSTVAAPLGDLSVFRTISADTLKMVLRDEPAAAKARIGDLEFTLDNAEALLRAANCEKMDRG